MKTSRRLVRYEKISGNHCPGDIAGIDVSDGKTLDEKGQLILTAGDRLLKQVGTVRICEPEEAIKCLTPKAMLEHGYTEAQVKSAVAKLEGEHKSRHEEMVAGESERLATQAAAKRKSGERQDRA